MEKSGQRKNIFPLITVICCLLFVLSCTDPINTSDGYGYIKVSLMGGGTAPQVSLQAARKMAGTALPDDTETLYDRYVYKFFKKGETTGEVEYPDSKGDFILKTGDYDKVEVIAYIGGVEKASGKSKKFTVASGENDPVPVSLTGRGFFSYTITWPEGADVKDITLNEWPEDVKDWPEKMSEIELNYLLDENGITEENKELYSGSYLLKVIVINEDEEEAKISVAVHVYPGLTTKYEKDFDDNDFLPDTFTVIFDVNGGTTKGEFKEYETQNKKGEEIILPDGVSLTKDNSTFGGWNTQSDGKGTPYNAGALYAPSGDIILYAKWESISPIYTVTFDANGASGDIPEPISANAGTAITLPDKGELSMIGYTFGGWNTNAGGSGTPYNENDFYTVNANTTLFAKWIYFISYNKNDASATNTMPNSEHTYNVAKPLSSNMFSRTGYNFAGWNTKADGTGDNYTDKESVKNLSPSSGTVELFAKWENNTFTVTFDANGASGNAPDPMTKNTGTPIILPGENELSKTGYTFGGWNTQVNGEGTNYKAGASYTPNGNVTLYAKWEPIKYTIIYIRNAPADAEGMKGEMYNSTHTYDKKENLRKCLFESDSHKFIGWAMTETGKDEYDDEAGVSNLSATQDDEITLYAKWELNAYTVTFDSDGGSNVTDQEDVKHGSKLKKFDPPKKDGYRLDFWYWINPSFKIVKFDVDNDLVNQKLSLIAYWEELKP